MKVRLGDYVSIMTGKLDANAAAENGKYPFFTCAVEPLKISTYSYDCECVLVAGNGDLNVKYFFGKFDAYQRTYIIESKNKSVLSVLYLFWFLDKYVETLRKQSIGGVIKYIKLGNLTEAGIELLPIEEQRIIVNRLEKTDSLITNRKQQLEKLDLLIKSRFIEMFGDPKHNDKSFKAVPVQEVAEDLFAGGDKPQDNSLTPDETYKYPVYSNGVGEKGLLCYSKTYRVNKQAITISARGAIGYSAIRNPYFTPVVRLLTLVPKGNINIVFLKHVLDCLELKGTGSSQQQLTLPEFKKLTVIVPPLQLQNEFARFVEQTDKTKSAIKQSLEKLETLKKSLMQKYFG